MVSQRTDVVFQAVCQSLSFYSTVEFLITSVNKYNGKCVFVHSMAFQHSNTQADIQSVKLLSIHDSFCMLMLLL